TKLIPNGPTATADIPLVPAAPPAHANGVLGPVAPPAPAAAPPADDAPAGPGMGAVFQALRRRWFLALSVALVSVAAAGAAAWHLLTPKATVRSSLLVSPTMPRLLFSTAENAADTRPDQA